MNLSRLSKQVFILFVRLEPNVHTFFKFLRLVICYDRADTDQAVFSPCDEQLDGKRELHFLGEMP